MERGFKFVMMIRRGGFFYKTIALYCEQAYNTYQGVTINGGRLAFYGGPEPSDYIETR